MSDEVGTTTQRTFEQEEFERVRQESLRAFEVRLMDGRVVSLFAHFHDGGNNAQGHLSFVIIDANGRQIVDRVFSVHVWDELREVGAANPQQLADAKDRLNTLMEGNDPTDETTRNEKTRQRRSRSRATMRRDVH